MTKIGNSVCQFCFNDFTYDLDLLKYNEDFENFCYNCYDDQLIYLYDIYLQDKEHLKKRLFNKRKYNSLNKKNYNMYNNKSNKKAKLNSDIERKLDEEIDNYFNNFNKKNDIDDNDLINDNKNDDNDNDNNDNDDNNDDNDDTDDNKLNKQLINKNVNNSIPYIEMKIDDFIKIISNNPYVIDEEKDKEDIKKDNKPDISKCEFKWIGDNIKNIKDLINLGESYDSDNLYQTNIDLWRLNKCVPALKELDTMIGMEKVKESIFYQIIFHLQKLDNENEDMHHTVIKGPPGVGKTQLTHIIAKIYKALGFLKTDKVISVKRDDLVAGYVGQTAIKTKKVLESALGGVLLIDEAYSFGQGDDKDSFSKEAIDLLTSYLSEHGKEFICIIAGYKDALEKRFFTLNDGLKRRFNIHYEIENYEPEECMKIFEKIIIDNNWNFAITDNDKYYKKTKTFFKDNIDKFPYYGGDMLTLFAFCKKAHSQRLLGIKTLEELNSSKKKINFQDLENGFNLFLINKCDDKNVKHNSNVFGFYT
jgi:hypothetical protein